MATTRPPMGNHPSLSEHRKRDRVLGLAIIVLAFGGCMGLSLWGMRVSTPQPAPPPPPVSQDGIVGFPDAIAPFDMIARAKALSVRDKFRGFAARGVKRDGTIDLTSSNAQLRLSFQSPQGRGPQPEREPGTLPERRYCGTQSVILDQTGISASEDRPKVPCGGKEIEELSVPPGCSLEALWKFAEKKKIRVKGTANIDYFEANGGPAFRFEKDGRSFVVSARDCEKELKGREQRGGLPHL